MNSTVLLTGGLGYIGSHTALALLKEDFSVVIIDNLDNTFPEVLARLQKLAGSKASKLSFIKADLRCHEDLDKVFSSHSFDAVIHFAGRKAVGESVAQPMLYYTHNVVGAVNLIEAMRKHGVRNMVFSSSATVYGDPQYVPLDEAHPLSALNPYGRSKLMIEDIFRDLYASDKEWKIILLRYFNPVGAHPSGEIGEHPVGIPNNLMPYIHQTALGLREALNVFGSDYNTRDGTAIRDYIHVQDLADGHVAALGHIFGSAETYCKPINLGTGVGSTVLEMVAAFEKASGKKINVKHVARRPGDAEAVWAATDTAEQVLGWKAKLGVAAMCEDQWRWAMQNPQGYQPSAN